jgi:hypothetical protein
VAAARATLAEAVAAADAIGDDLLSAQAAFGVGRVALLNGELADAEASLRHALEGFSRRGDLRYQALVQSYVAWAAALRGDPEAVAVADEARDLAVDAGDNIVVIDVTKTAGLVRALVDRTEDASELLVTAIMEYSGQGRGSGEIADALEAAEILAGRCRVWPVVGLLEGAVSARARTEVQAQTVAARTALAANAAAALGADGYADAHRRGSTMSAAELASMVATLHTASDSLPSSAGGTPPGLQSRTLPDARETR